MQNNESISSPSNRMNDLRRWGLAWIVIGFLILVTGLFNLDHPIWTAFGMLVVMLVSPDITRPRRWLFRLIALVIGMLVLIFALLGLLGVAEAFHLNPGLVFSATALFIGIILQIWAEINSGAATQGQTNPLIEKIKRL